MVVSVVEDVDEIGEERMDVFQVGELIDNGLELLNAGGLSELDLSHIKLLNSLDFITWVNDSGCFSLCLGQNNINHLSTTGYVSHILEIYFGTHL